MFVFSRCFCCCRCCCSMNIVLPMFVDTSQLPILPSKLIRGIKKLHRDINMENKAKTTNAPKPPPKLGKSGKKICCSCPETKKVRDLCIVSKGEEHCADVIEAHKKCLREEGFTVK